MLRVPFCFVVLALLVGMAGCTAGQKADKPARATVAVAAPQTDRTGWPVIVAFGDSLTAGQGIKLDEAYPALLERELDRQGYKYRVVNSGVSGDTTAQGLARLSVVLQQKPQVVILGLGGNDGLRGQSLAKMRENLSAIIERLQQEQVKVVLSGIQIPPNYGPDYTQEFRQSFHDLAARHKVAFIPFILEGIAAIPELNLPDGIHPTPEGHKLMLNNVLPVLMPLLKK